MIKKDIAGKKINMNEYKNINEINNKEIWVKCNMKSDIEFEISNLGNIREKESKNIKHQYIDKRWNLKIITVYLNKKRKNYMVHRLIVSSFNENYNNSKIFHKDNNKLNNNLNNLLFETNQYKKEEIWKPSYISENYLVSNLGRVKNIKTNRILKPSSDGKNEYQNINLSIDKSSKGFKLHRLIMLTFHQEGYKKGLWINHKDGNKSNNKLENLEWCTPKENFNHAIKNNLFKIGKMNRFESVG